MKTRVLVIDDDASIREAVKAVLQGEDYEVLLAADGQEGIDRFDPQELDLLLLDINLPVRNGWDAFEEITARNPCLPIIVITGEAGQHRTAEAAGVSAFIEKPIDAQLLLETIRELLAEPKEQRLRRLVKRIGRLRHVPADAQRVFEDLLTRYSTPHQWDLPSSNLLPPKTSYRKESKTNQRNERENDHH
jgi:CheY-like chemotaxis protein